MPVGNDQRRGLKSGSLEEEKEKFTHKIEMAISI